MAIVLHLLTRSSWSRCHNDGVVSNPSLHEVGFLHCTDDAATLLRVANTFYADNPEEFVALEVDTERLDCPCIWEPPAHPSPTDERFEQLFPHVYGTIALEAIVGERGAMRDATGAFVDFA